MTVVAVAVLLGIAVVMMLKWGTVKVGAALLCILLGLVIGATPAGPAVNEFLTFIGEWIWALFESW